MANSKKSASKSTAKSDSKKSQSNDSMTEARPIGAGKDPLAEGNTLVNPTNTEAETHYEVKERGEDVQAAETSINGQDANERAEQHNQQLTQGAPSHDTPNHDTEEQDEVAEGRVEPGEEQAANDTPEETEVPDLSDEEQADNAEDREKALAKDRKTFGK